MGVQDGGVVAYGLGRKISGLGNDFLNRIGSLGAHQPFIEAAVEKSQVVRVEPHELQNGGVQVFNVKWAFHSAATQLIG